MDQAFTALRSCQVSTSIMYSHGFHVLPCSFYLFVFQRLFELFLSGLLLQHTR